MVTREEAKRLYDMLDPLRGEWIAVDFGWQRVLAHDVDRAVCVEKARGLRLEKPPIIYLVPKAPAPQGGLNISDIPTDPSDTPRPVAMPV